MGEEIIRVGIADDHALTREGLVDLLGTAEGVVVVSEASDGEQALSLLEEGEAPDVLLLDVEMPGVGGIEVARRVAVEHPNIGVIMLTAYDDPGRVTEAVRAGARGYVLKTIEGDGLIEAVRAVAGGGMVIDLGLAEALADDGPRDGLPRRHRPLTNRELEVLQLLGAGLTNAQIGERLGIAIGTVRIHLGRIFMKLGTSDRGALMAEALRHNALG